MLLMPPQSPSPEYDFIYKDQPQPKRGLSLPGSGLPKSVRIILGATLGLFLIIILYVVLFGNKTASSDQLVGVIGRAQEIARVSEMVQQQSKDQNTINLAATTGIALSSDKSQLSSYLIKHHQKVSANQLITYKNSNIDTQLQAASQNNSLDTFYSAYLKKQLDAYHATLASAYSTTGPNGKSILKTSNDSVETLLNTAQLKAS